MRKNLQLFHDMVTKRWESIIGWSKLWMKSMVNVLLCWQTTENVNCVQGEDSKWEQLIYLWQVNFKVIFKKYSEMNAVSAVLT